MSALVIIYIPREEFSDHSHVEKSNKPAPLTPTVQDPVLKSSRTFPESINIVRQRNEIYHSSDKLNLETGAENDRLQTFDDEKIKENSKSSVNEYSEPNTSDQEETSFAVDAGDVQKPYFGENKEEKSFFLPTTGLI